MFPKPINDSIFRKHQIINPKSTNLSYNELEIISKEVQNELNYTNINKNAKYSKYSSNKATSSPRMYNKISLIYKNP